MTWGATRDMWQLTYMLTGLVVSIIVLILILVRAQSAGDKAHAEKKAVQQLTRAEGIAQVESELQKRGHSTTKNISFENVAVRVDSQSRKLAVCTDIPPQICAMFDAGQLVRAEVIEGGEGSAGSGIVRAIVGVFLGGVGGAIFGALFAGAIGFVLLGVAGTVIGGVVGAVTGTKTRTISEMKVVLHTTSIDNPQHLIYLFKERFAPVRVDGLRYTQATEFGRDVITTVDNLIRAARAG